MTTMSTGGGNGAASPSVPVMMSGWPYADAPSDVLARELRGRVDRMMAALLSGPTGFERTSGDLAKYALEAIQAVDDVLAAEGVE